MKNAASAPQTTARSPDRGGWSLCHVFVFVDALEPAADAVRAAGLVESFRRVHPGQGTANICFCLDNAYVELLAVVDSAEIRSPAIAPAGLAERAAWRDTGACAIGIAVRPVAESGSDRPPPFAAWDWRPPYLPEGMSIPVAEASRDPRLPFVFRSPGSRAPRDWTDGRAGGRQVAAGITTLNRAILGGPGDVMGALVPAGLGTVIGPAGLVDTAEEGDWRLDLDLARPDSPDLRISLMPGRGIVAGA